MSKSQGDFIDPQDLVEGTEKLSGLRSHGYGLDVLRLWTAKNDTDSNLFVDQEDLDKCNQDLKNFRSILS